MSKVFSQLKNAIIMPLQGSMDAFKSGVFSDGNCIEHTLLERSSPATLQKATRQLGGNYIYGGYLFGHYGHFLLESLSRVYAIKQCKPLPVLFCSPNNFIASWQRRIFKLLGLENELELITVPTQVQSLVISPPGCSIPNFILPEQIKALGQIFISPGKANKKVWLSRSKFKGGGVNDEPVIEDKLANSGWQIIHPQTLDIYEQVELIASAQYVAGFDGSAFYTALLAKQVYGHFIVFGRRNSIPRTLSHMLAEKGISCEEHVFDLKHVSGIAAESRFEIDNPEKVLNVLLGF